MNQPGYIRHHAVVRITHWVNAFALTLMVGSGLRIFNAYPAFARRGETFCCYPFERRPIPAGLTFGGWLAGARNWHFAAMWLLVVNGLVYLGFIYLHGEWRDLVPRRGILRDALEMVKFYVAARRDHPRQGKHNALQRLAYFSMPIVGIFAVLTGLAIWKPVQLSLLTSLFGGYVWARYWHFWTMWFSPSPTPVSAFRAQKWTACSSDSIKCRPLDLGHTRDRESACRWFASSFICMSGDVTVQ